MIAGTPVVDLDDVASLEAADIGGALRSAASGGAQVRATAAAVAEDALTRLSDMRPRSLVLVSGSGRAARAAALLIAALGDRTSMPLVPATAIPPWVGPLDVVLVAGDDAGDPRMAQAVEGAVRRGAEVIVAAPDEGPLRAAAAGRATLLAPRVPVLDHNRLLRYLAVGMAVLKAVDPNRMGPLIPDLNALADLLDAEALRDGPQHEAFHNPAKNLATRMQQRPRLVLAGDSPATTEVALHGSEVLLAAAGQVATAANLAETIAAHTRMVEAAGVSAPGFDPLFHDEQLDGPAPVQQVRVFVVSADSDEMAVRRRLAVFGAEAGLVDADLVNVDNVDAEQAAAALQSGSAPEAPGAPVGRGGELEQLAVLVLRIEMAAAYLRLLGSRPVTGPGRYDGGHY
ncbi:tobH protein [Nocardia huaxiensis]|uniref:TobH protein n=1 Tax=Nocardia huaxiensis TaxID=2755382 RepID=A0A7D6Z6L1_9NOCA|nr:tobH protein [Nocardia huaxiensis]QLY32904.1 tobH protein [Nocardia huaxiensis]UFS93336.1 tobH protein [Nocardia huaxiensis]